jgi:hypothetical protein
MTCNQRALAAVEHMVGRMSIYGMMTPELEQLFPEEGIPFGKEC